MRRWARSNRLPVFYFDESLTFCNLSACEISAYISYFYFPHNWMRHLLLGPQILKIFPFNVEYKSILGLYTNRKNSYALSTIEIFKQVEKVEA